VLDGEVVAVRRQKYGNATTRADPTSVDSAQVASVFNEP